MKPFVAPVEDILFCLEHVAGATDLADWDGDLVRELGGHFATFAEQEIAPLDAPGDRQGCRLENGRVRMPGGFARVYQDYAAMGWPGLTVPESHGGQGLGPVMLAVTSEIFSGACHSVQMVTGLVPGAVRTLQRFGTDDQQARYLPSLATGETLATMCLTEPEAGSDLCRIRCRAVAKGDGWAITGEKIFISGGDQDLSDRILHLVLARTSDDGLRGLSLFLCPSETAQGARNAVTVTRVEDKMGLHASPTCQMEFDGAEAELIGRPGDGLKAMFTMMNHARLDVALQGVAHAARARDIAAAYAAERGQGRKPDGEPAVLADHADVQRMLDEMDRLALGGRAVAHLALVTMERGDDPDLVEFLTPVAKVFCTEAGMHAAELGTQVLGGYGYLREYRLEQTYRDARITAIYEGANGIHARMVATRLLGAAPGDAFDCFVDREARAAGCDVLHRGVGLWRAARQTLITCSDPAPQAFDFMKLTQELLLLCLWYRLRRAADRHPEPGRITRVAEQGGATATALMPAHAAKISGGTEPLRENVFATVSQ